MKICRTTSNSQPSEENLALGRLEQIHALIADNFRIQSENPWHWFLSENLAKARKTVGAIIRLCEKGFGEDGHILLRTLLEQVVNISFIKTDPDKWLAEFYDYNIALGEKYFNEKVASEKLAFGQYFDQEAYVQHLEKDKADILAQGRDPNRFRQGTKQKIRNKWSGKSVVEMAAEVDAIAKPDKEEKSLVWHYHTVYWLGSNLSHSNPKSLHYFYDVQNNCFICGSSENFCLQTILPTTSLFYRLLWLFAEETQQTDLKTKLSAIMMPGSLDKK